jgi:transposase-like protein
MSQENNGQLVPNGQVSRHEPSPEVVPSPRYRHFSREYKLRILAEADQCQRGEIGVLLRREGLHSSALSKWREQQASGRLEEPSQSQGREERQVKEMERLKRENARLAAKLAKAEAVIEMQKKLSALLALDEE